MLTAKDKKIIADINDGSDAFSEESRSRYPKTVIHAFKGELAFDLHAKMVHLEQKWIDDCTDRKKSLLLIVKQLTISKASLNSGKMPSRQIQRIFSIFHTACSPVPVHSILKGKKWITLVKDAKEHDLL